MSQRGVTVLHPLEVCALIYLVIPRLVEHVTHSFVFINGGIVNTLE